MTKPKSQSKSSKQANKPSVILWGDWTKLTDKQRNSLRLFFKCKRENTTSDGAFFAPAGDLLFSQQKPALRSNKGTKILSLSRALKQQAEAIAAKKASRAASKAASNVPSTTPTKTRQTTKMVFCLDRSGSMQGLTSQVKALYAKNLETIRNSATGDHDIYVSVYYFDDQIERKKLNSPVHALSSDLPEFTARGGTSIYDCVNQAVGAIVSPNDDPKTTGYAVMVLTDGYENASKMTSDDFRRLILAKQATDQWTFTFLMPPEGVQRFISQTGVHAGNCQGWTDIKVAEKEHSIGIQSYMTARSTGTRSVKAFYVNAPSAKQMAKLPTLTGAKVWTVDKEAVIQPFVESHGQTFAPGHSYYQLMKPETVQDYKNVLAIKKGTKEIKADVRGLLGLPTVGDVKVKPGDHGEWDLFVQSNSTNRKLPRGTKLIYLPV